jgi:hypothetical protein
MVNGDMQPVSPQDTLEGASMTGLRTLAQAKFSKEVQAMSSLFAGSMTMALDVARFVGINKKLSIAQVHWLENHEEALKKAYEMPGDPQKGAGLVMALFTGSDWCPHGKNLDGEVFQTSKFR